MGAMEDRAYKKKEKRGMEELIEEVRRIKKCLEEVVVILRKECIEAGEGRNDGGRSEKSVGREEESKGLDSV